MTTSIDLSIDELLLLEENQYHMSNLVLANIKPIGAERKIGQSTNIKSSIQENKVCQSVAPPIMSIYDHFHFSPIDESSMNEYELSASSSIVHSPQRQLPTSIPRQNFNQSISTRDILGTTQNYSNSRFYPSQYHVRNSFLNICQQTRTTSPMFSAPFQCHRERFQVNSIGRPILRTNNLLQGYHLKVRR